jgi:hypothetical protein
VPSRMSHFDLEFPLAYAQQLKQHFGGDLFFPDYRDGARGAWNVRMVSLAASRGYWGQVYPGLNTAILGRVGAEGRESWMSLLPSEIESQVIGLRAARGHTAVLGLGMGWLAANVALRPEVERVTVVEADPDVIAIVEAMGVMAQLSEAARRKVTIVRGDALSWRPDGPVDTLQADIWLKFVEDRKLADAQRMQANIEARSVYFWGQEMEIWRFACGRLDDASALDWPTVRTIVAEDIRLPLILPDWSDYPERIVAAARWWAPQASD